MRLALALAAAGAALLAALASVPAQAAAVPVAPAGVAKRPAPALWVVKSPTATVYLFGTVHLMRPELSWETPAVRSALDASRELWLEIKEAGSAPGAPNPDMIALVQKYGLDPAHPLSTKIPAADQTRLDAALKDVGLSPAQVEPLRPWLVSIQLTVAPMVKAGYDPKAGVDSLLGQEAARRGIELKAFETQEQQIRYFADLPLKDEVAELSETLDEYQLGSKRLDEVAAAWARGDVAAIDRLVDEDLKAKDPDLYQVLLVQRNQRFAQAIAERLKGTGTAFVAVGAGHLAGPDDVQAQLTKLGFTARRVAEN